MTINCIVTDFDGTLLDDQKKISAKNFSALACLKQKRVIVAIATGRSLESFTRAIAAMEPDISLQNLPVDYVIFSTGAGILRVSDQKIIYAQSINRNDIQTIAGYFDDSQTDYMIHKAIPETDHLLYKRFDRKNPDFEMRLSLYATYANRLYVFSDQFESATQVLAILAKHKGAETVARIRQHLDAFSVIPATSPLDHRSLWIEVFHKNVSKSSTTAWLCRRLNVLPVCVAAIGNDYNDKDLLEWAGTGYVVDNAPDELKKKFKTAASNNNSGFHDALVRLKLVTNICGNSVQASD